MQSAPLGAQCALHAGVTASLVCARCGNFMCGACSENGTQAQCPSCRSLSAARFPYDASADFGTLWSHTFGVFQREALMLIVATLILFGFVMGGGLLAQLFSSVVLRLAHLQVDESNPLANIGAWLASMAVSQVFSVIINIAVQGVAMVGYYRLLIDALSGRRLDVGRMFAQLHLFVRYVGLQVVMFFIVTVPTLVYFVFALVAAASAAGIGASAASLSNANLYSKMLSGPFVGTMLLAMLGYLVIAVIILPLSLFALPELVLGDCGPIEALRRAWVLGSGQRLRVLGYSFVAFLVVLAGLFLCCVGMLPALPLATLLVTALYLALRNSSGLPAAREA